MNAGDGIAAEAQEVAGFRKPGPVHYWLRRLHSTMGLVFGGYIATHLLVNMSGLWPRSFQENVDRIHSLGPWLPWVELTGIFIPLLVHALYGAYVVAARVHFDTTKYHYGGVIREALQRWTAVILLLFIAFHVGTLHQWGLSGVHRVVEWAHPMPDPLPHDANGYLDAGKLDWIQRFSFWCSDYGGRFDPRNEAFQTTAAGVRNLIDYLDDPLAEHFHFWNAAVAAFYLAGVWSAAIHFAIGLWTVAIAWGVTVTAHAQRRWGHACLVMGLGLMIVGTTAWYAFALSANAKGDLTRWDGQTHTLPDADSEHP